MDAASRKRVEALQRELMQAAVDSMSVRTTALRLCRTTVYLAGIFVLFHPRTPIRTLTSCIGAVGFSVTAAVVFSTAVAVPLAGAYRELQRRRLWRKVRALPLRERGEVLIPL